MDIISNLINEKSRVSDFERKILPLRQQAEVTNRWLDYRLKYLLPEIMKREGFDMWIVAAREYNEDPVTLTLLPATMLSARRLTILMFFLQKDGTLEKISISKYNIGGEGLYRGVWDGDTEDQWQCLSRIVKERNPQCIGINYSDTFAFGDGLTHTLYEHLMDAIGNDYSGRVKSAERLAVGWLEKRSKDEISAYSGINQIAHGVIAEAFSNRVVHPGITTANDLEWWIRQRIHDLGFQAWFQPDITIQRRGCSRVDGTEAIIPGDLLHCDVGLHYLGLATDTQQNAYVLQLGEEDAPGGLKSALRTGNRLQDILSEECIEGKTGNEILLSSLSRAKKEGINASIYTHPIGYHGHGAGPTIGLWDMQQGVPGRGDYELYSDTCHAMELNIKQSIPEWDGQEIMMALEQTIVFTGGRVHYLGGRQTKLHLIQ